MPTDRARRGDFHAYLDKSLVGFELFVEQNLNKNFYFIGDFGKPSLYEVLLHALSRLSFPVLSNFLVR